ncbi:MAG: shikimate kinase, partial [Desulfobia sp.]
MCHRKTKILLTGYRATGKSLIGKEVARRLGFAFLDTDREIEKRAGKTIKSMVAEKGWPYFRALEKKLLDDLADRENMVVASGGGAVMNHNSWQRLRRSAFTIWLSASAGTICSRLAADSKSGDQRPSLTDKDVL